MHRIGAYLVILLLYSCSDLEDTDITSYDALKKLKLTSITLRQTLAAGSYTKDIPVSDSVMNISFSLGKLTRQRKLNWGNVEGSSKFSFRSGAINNIIVRNRYFDNGRIYSSIVFSEGKVRELYFFGYNTSGKLVQLATKIFPDPLDLTKVVDTYDTLFYDNSGFTGSAVRSSRFDATKRGIFTAEPISINPCQLLWVFKRSVNTNNPADDKEYNYCGPNNLYIYPGGQSADFYSNGSDFVEEVYIGDRLTETDKKCCADKYFYHPILFEPVLLHYKIMYAVDWWKEVSPTSPGKDENVHFNFSYAQ